MSSAAITVPLDGRGPYLELAIRLTILDETRDPFPGRLCAVCDEQPATLELAPSYARPTLVRDPDPTPVCGTCLAKAVTTAVLKP